MLIEAFSSSSSRSVRQISPEELAAIEQHNANIAAVSYKLESHQNLLNYLNANPAIAGQVWGTPDIVRRMNEEPNLLAEIDASPEAQLQSLFAQHPIPQRQYTSGCCTII